MQSHAMIEDPQLHQLFEAESEEHLSRLDDGLLRLEKNCTDQEVLEEVFREAHSLKGSARMLGLTKIEMAAHGLESILNTARKGDSLLTADTIEHMTVVLRDLRVMVREALGSTPVTTETVINSTASPELAIVNLEENAKLQTAPQKSIEDLAPSRTPSTFVEPFRIETVRVETSKLDDLLTLTGELSVIQGRVQHRLSMIDEISEQWLILERSRKKFQYGSCNVDGLDKSSEPLRKMLQMDNEALTLLGSKIKKTRESFYEDCTRFEATAITLQEQVHSVRLMPFSVVFTLFPRMVRDLAKELRKEVELEIEGGEINVDKHILEEIKDPLMHMLRNAVDHGIELPDVREHQCKPRSGRLRLSAVKEGNNVILEVQDDGCGLDIQAIRNTALNNGLYDEATLASMPQAQLQQLILLPGFSTSTYVTEMSGRGVGLDVVRANVERLKGEILIKSTMLQGTMMQLRLPLGLSTTRVLLVSVGGYLYGLPIEFVVTSQRVKDENIFTLEGRPAFELNGQAIIAPGLADLLELSRSDVLTQKKEGGIEETVCIVIQVGEERLGLRVDELLDEEEVLTKPLGAPLQRVRNVSGMAILGSGEICAILNQADLLRSAHKLAVVPSQGKPDRPVHQAKACILLVEDSVLVRVMEQRILEEAGYEVITAVDGKDALNKLGSRPFVAIVSDINMPNMDGLAFTAQIRQEPHYRDLPVILVTSLASNEDKRRGLEVGANAYIPKPSFDKSVLLETLQRLIVK